jgi:Viral BACON domain
MDNQKRAAMTRTVQDRQLVQRSRAVAVTLVLMLWSSSAWGATLTWNANNEPDLAGYRVYQCSQQPCGRAFGSATLLATLGTGTSFNIGTPAVTQYYVITAFDFANNESSESNVATYTPPTSTPPPTSPPPTSPPPTTPPPPAIGLSPTNLSFSATQGGSNPATRTISVSNTGGGTLTWSASDNANWLTLSPTSGTNNGTITLSAVTGSLQAGTYNAVITLNAAGTAPVTAPVTFTVTAAPPPPPPSTTPPPPTTPPPAPPSAAVTLNVLGAPNLGQPWSVQATTNASGTISVEVRVNGSLDHTERRSPFCAFGESNGTCTRVQKPAGNYNVEFRVLSGGTEVARQSVLVTAAAPPSSTPPPSTPPGPPPLVPPPVPGNLRIGLVQ